MKTIQRANKGQIILLWFLLVSMIGCDQIDQHHKTTFKRKMQAYQAEMNMPAFVAIVFNSDTIIDSYFGGTIHIKSSQPIDNKSSFHLGSNTKAFIGFAAASMVEDNLISWDTKYFDLFPEEKSNSSKEYADIILTQLLRHRAGLPENHREFRELMLPYIDKDTTLHPTTLTNWALNQPKFHGGYQYSNIGYVMAARMMEQMEGKPWKQIIQERVLDPLSISANYGWPALNDSLQVWGHIKDSVTNEWNPHPPDDLYNLSKYGFGPPGDMNITPLEHIVFLQDNLKGYNGQGGILASKSYNIIHDQEEYGLGWANVDKVHTCYNLSIHSGSGGTFYCKSLLFKDDNFGIALYTNCYPDNINSSIYGLVNDIIDIYIND